MTLKQEVEEAMADPEFEWPDAEDEPAAAEVKPDFFFFMQLELKTRAATRVRSTQRLIFVLPGVRDIALKGKDGPLVILQLSLFYLTY